MIERRINIGNLEPIEFFGIKNSKLNIIKEYFPKLKITARGNEIIVQGESSEISFFETKIENILEHLQKYNTLTVSNIKRLENIVFKSNEEIRSRLRPEPEYSDGRGEWVDISGLFAPQQSIDKLIKKIISGEIDSLDTINAYFEELHKNYYDLEWTWAYECILKWYGLEPENICVEDIIDIVTTWKDAVIGLDKLIYEDARKEFSMNAQVGFGADSCNKASDFEQVRGDFENNTFVSDVRKHIEEKRALGDELLKRCRNMQEDKADF